MNTHPYEVIGNCFLVHGDCLSVMEKELHESALIDLVVADLPYGTTSCKWDTVIPFEKLWEQYNRLVKTEGAVVLTGSEPFSSALRMSNVRAYKYDWIWYKNTSSGIPTASFMPMKNYETVSVFCKGKTIFNKQPTQRRSEQSKARVKYKLQGNGSNLLPLKEIGERQYDPDNCNPRMVLEIDTEPNSLGKMHPTQKPVALMEYFIRTYSNEGDLILDNTMGSGTTVIASLNTNRRCIGIEKDDKYFSIAVDRVRKHYALLGRH